MLVSLAALSILPGLERVQQLLDLPTNAFGLATGALAMVAADDAECRIASAPSSLPMAATHFQQSAAAGLSFGAASLVPGMCEQANWLVSLKTLS